MNCAPGCYTDWPGDSWCDLPCMNEECNFDGGDCDTDENCSPGCYSTWTGDGWCDY